MDKQQVLDAIRQTAEKLGHSPSRSEFEATSGLSEYHVLRNFPSWREAVRQAGLEPNSTNIKLDDNTLLQDWGKLLRKHKNIPTSIQYGLEGTFSVDVLRRRFGGWSSIPYKFRIFAENKPEWADVLALLPPSISKAVMNKPSSDNLVVIQSRPSHQKLHTKLEAQPTYGNPIDFRGLRHEPVNEQGVVFLFGMVARELGYSIEAIQQGFPDCEAKRQVDTGKWQRVRIEFEYESRNFRDHGHPVEGADVVVCWKHNWPDCPLEVLELSTAIGSLAKSKG